MVFLGGVALIKGFMGCGLTDEWDLVVAALKKFGVSATPMFSNLCNAGLDVLPLYWNLKGLR